MGLVFPSLVFPGVISRFLWFFGLTTIIGGALYAFIASRFLSFSYANWWIPIFGVGLLIIMTRVLRPYKVEFEQKDLRSFIESVLTMNYKNLHEHSQTNRKEMERILSLLIHDKIGADLNEIKPEAKLVDDLGLN